MSEFVVNVAVMGRATVAVPFDAPTTVARAIEGASLTSMAEGKQIKMKIGEGALNVVTPDTSISENAFVFITRDAKGAA